MFNTSRTDLDQIVWVVTRVVQLLYESCQGTRIVQVVTRQSTIVGEIVPDTQWCNTSWYGGFGKSYDRVLVRVQLSTDRMTYDTGRVKSRVWWKMTETTAEKRKGKKWSWPA